MASRILISAMVLLCILSSPLSAKEKHFSEVVVEVIDSLDKQMQNKYGESIKNAPFIITTPVNINNFSQTNPLARQLGQEIATQLVQKHYSIEEIRNRKEIITIVDAGEFILSRTPAIDASYRIGFIVSGTYIITGAGVRLSVEVINIADSTIVAMETLSIPSSREIEILTIQDNAVNSGNTRAVSVQSEGVQMNVTNPTPMNIGTVQEMY